MDFPPFGFLPLTLQIPPQDELTRKDSSSSSLYPRPVAWLPTGDFYALPAAFSLVHSEVYRAGRVYGQDVSSGAAVAALLEDCARFSSSSVRILDLCCAPGQKLLALADGLSPTAAATTLTIASSLLPTTTIVGVDVSADRLAVCQKALRKYYASPTSDARPRIRVYCADGTTFGADRTDLAKLLWDSTVAEQDTAAGRKRLNKSARARQRKQLQAVVNLDWDTAADEAPNGGSTSPCIESFHAVLVDAECSTDGSIKHVQKRRRLEWTTERLPELVALQRQLAASGFRLLKQGGTLVYATCSLSTDQNEGVVEWLLQEFKSEAKLVAVTFPKAPPSVCAGSLPGTLRFWPSEDPEELTGGGFFLAKIRKE